MRERTAGWAAVVQGAGKLTPDVTRCPLLRSPALTPIPPARSLRPVLGQAIILAGLLAAGTAAKAQSMPLPTEPNRCKLFGWVVDADGKTNVRAAPSASARVVGTLPAATKRLQSGDEGASVSIIGSKDGYFLIENADVEDIESANPDRKVAGFYKGRGWVHGTRLTTNIQFGDGLRASPSPTAPVTVRFKGVNGDGSGESDAYAAILHSCSGKSLEATVHTLEDKPIGRGWLVNESRDGKPAPVILCSMQLTSCN